MLSIQPLNIPSSLTTTYEVPFSALDQESSEKCSNLPSDHLAGEELGQHSDFLEGGAACTKALLEAGGLGKDGDLT